MKLPKWLTNKVASADESTLDDGLATNKPSKVALEGLITLHHRVGDVSTYRIWINNPTPEKCITEHYLWNSIDEWFHSTEQVAPLRVETGDRIITCFDRSDVVRISITDETRKEE